MLRRLLIIPVLIVLIANSIVFAAIETEDEEFSFANKAFEDKFYEIAKEQFASFAKKYPRSNKIDQAYLMLGQCYYNLDKLLPAITELEKVLAKAHQLNLTDTAYYWLGEIYFKGKDFSAARDYFQRVVTEFPESRYKNYSLHSIALTFYETAGFREALLLWDKLNAQELGEDLLQDVELHRGLSYFKLADYDQAKQFFLSYIQKFPRSNSLDEAYYYLGEANFNSSDYNGALENYSQVITRFPRSDLLDLARFGIAWVYLKMERFEAAQEYFVKFLGSNPKSQVLDSAISGLATSLAKQSKYEDALGFYERLIKDFPDSAYIVSAYLGKADCLYNLSQYQEAVNFCLEAIKKFNKQADKDDFYYTLGWAYQKMGKVDEAILTFEDLLHYSDDETIKASSLARLGDIYSEKREFKRAQEAYDNILREYSHSPYADYAQMQIGVVFYNLGKYDVAVMALRSLAVNFPKTRFLEDAQYYIAMAYFKKGDFPAAAEEFSKLANSNSHYAAESSVKRGICFMNAGRYAEAWEIFKKLKIAGVHQQYLAAVDYYTAWAQYFLGREKEAIKALNEFVLRYPESEIVADIVFWLGEYYYRNKDWDKARDYFLQVLSRFPQDDLVDDADYWLGWVSYRKKDYLGSIRYFEHLAASYPGSPLVPDAFYRKGMILKDMGMFKEAENIFQQVEKRFPETHFYYLALKEEAQLRKQEKDFTAALSLLRKAQDSSLIEFNALVEFDIASLFEETGDLNQALKEYLKIIYLKGLKNQLLFDKTNMKIAGILERQEKWYGAEEIYSRLAALGEEPIRRLAQERLDWIRTKVK